VASHLVENPRTARAIWEPSINTEDGNIVFEVDAGKSVSISVAGEKFVLEDVAPKVAQLLAAQEALKKTVSEDFAQQISGLQTEMAQLKNDIAAELSAGIEANALAIKENAQSVRSAEEAGDELANEINTNVQSIKGNKAQSDVISASVSSNSVNVAANSVKVAANEKTLAKHDLKLFPPCQDNIKWVRFQAGKTPKMLGGYGIKEVKRLGAGVYNVVFTNKYPDNRFGIALMAEEQGYPSSSLRRVTASLGGSRGGVYDKFDNFMFPDRVIVQTRRTQKPAGLSDHPVIVNFAVFREDESSNTCNDYIKGKGFGNALRYVVYMRQTNRGRGKVHVENGLQAAASSSAGQWINLVPAASSSSAYSVASCVSGNDDGSYMGLEGYVQGGPYTQFYKNRFAQDSRKDGNGRPDGTRIISTIAVEKLSNVNDKKLKILTFKGGGMSNVYANVGVAKLKKIRNGEYRITWTTPFKDANYAVFGLANMWCSGGQMMHVADSRSFKQTASETQITTTYPYNNYVRAAGGEDGTGCAFMTLIALGDH